MDESYRDNWDDWFPARLTAKSGSSPILYSWTEQVIDTSTKQYRDADFGRSGTASAGPAVEVNDQSVVLPAYCYLRRKGEVDGDQVYEFAAASVMNLWSSEVLSDWSTDQTAVAFATATAVIKQVRATADLNLHGLAAGTTGQFLVLYHYGLSGTGKITVKHDSLSDSSANRFLCPNQADQVLWPGDSALCWYTGSNWAVLPQSRPHLNLGGTVDATALLADEPSGVYCTASGGVVTLHAYAATTSQKGVVTGSSQTWAGNKEFADNVQVDRQLILDGALGSLPSAVGNYGYATADLNGGTGELTYSLGMANWDGATAYAVPRIDLFSPGSLATPPQFRVRSSTSDDVEVYVGNATTIDKGVTGTYYGGTFRCGVLTSGLTTPPGASALATLKWSAL